MKRTSDILAWGGMVFILTIGILSSSPTLAQEGHVGLSFIAQENVLLGDEGRFMALDSAGNVIVAGASWNGYDYDYVITKYAPNGTWVWGRRYNGPAAKHDIPWALTVDSQDNVYVTGSSCPDAFTDDYVTIKYDKDGNWVWGRRYNGPANSGDAGFALAVDSAGNVIVTGVSSNGANFDYVTISYGANGNWLWGRRYNGSGNQDDGALALKVDDLDNVYVTGFSTGAISQTYDRVTIKYDKDGTWVWGQRYAAP